VPRGFSARRYSQVSQPTIAIVRDQDTPSKPKAMCRKRTFHISMLTIADGRKRLPISVVSHSFYWIQAFDLNQVGVLGTVKPWVVAASWTSEGFLA
jgi:hypothetical protein